MVHEQTGLGVSADFDTPRRRAAFARYANILLNDPQRARRLADAAGQRALGEFTVDAMVARYADLYREILAH